MPGGFRHVYGPRPVGALVPALTRAAFRRRAPAATQVLTDWPAIVGPALAAVTAPRRLQGGTLAIACSGPIALELQHVGAELLARINGALGRPVVERLRFVQDMNPPPLPPQAPPPPSPAIMAAVGRSVAGLPAGELRDALARLGCALFRDHVPRSTNRRGSPCD
ncbi:MAG: DUF721 domain-containing protein [Acetobacteraceae bacterium]|nr:DUF721 domain-containing protein [Acetobacteraceae bacterium]